MGRGTGSAPNTTGTSGDHSQGSGCVSGAGGGLDMTRSKRQSQGHSEQDGPSRTLAEGKLR